MRVYGLDDKQYIWNLTGASPDRPLSGPHLAVRDFLKELYPIDPIIEELTLPGTKGLRVDFFLPRRNLIVEIHGRQHFEFVSHFHSDRFGFANSLVRDNKKRSFANINEITLVELKEDETHEQWRRAIIKAMGRIS